MGRLLWQRARLQGALVRWLPLQLGHQRPPILGRDTLRLGRLLGAYPPCLVKFLQHVPNGAMVRDLLVRRVHEALGASQERLRHAGRAWSVASLDVSRL